MLSNQETSKGVALLQTALDAVRSEDAERQQQLKDVQLKLADGQKRIAELENEKSLFSAKNTTLQQHRERLENRCSDLLGQVVVVNEQLDAIRDEKSALETQLAQQQRAHETDLERANDSSQKLREENEDLRRRLAQLEEQAARVPSLEAVQKEYRSFAATIQKAAADLSTHSEAIRSADRQACKRRNAEVYEIIVR
ncbi:hypothetical protein AAVH_09697 [Aphelenchoides avenae]|nr:hypothetical protein AAVH_09697 [Aphelenchus avenae]